MGELARNQDTPLSKIHDRSENKILQQGGKTPAHAIYDPKIMLQEKFKQLEAQLSETVQAVTRARKGLGKGLVNLGVFATGEAVCVRRGMRRLRRTVGRV